jgi:hypothetical protein
MDDPNPPANPNAETVSRRDPYHVPIPVRILAVPIGMVAIWMAARDLTSLRVRGVLEGIGEALIALYCFYCAARGRSVPWLESEEEATKLVDRLTKGSGPR